MLCSQVLFLVLVFALRDWFRVVVFISLTSAPLITIVLVFTSSWLQVGILDVDLCGPSVPRMLGVEGAEMFSCPDGWVPIYKFEQRLAIMSIGFMLGDKSEAVVWRGPKKTAMIKQFLSDVVWGELDYLVIDTPPGTSDEHLAVVECLRQLQPDGAVLVTTPQGLSLADVMREATFCKKAKIKMLGLVENMSGFVCPHCSECTNLFSSGGGERLAEAIPCPFLGRIPIDPEFGKSVGEGENYLEKHPEGQTHDAIMSIISKLIAE
eukprot:m.38855 g.38855  ORF g.38855 m.38855 type:complete len:265 (-) comp11534_c0_seq3:64-858(-)